MFANADFAGRNIVSTIRVRNPVKRDKRAEKGARDNYFRSPNARLRLNGHEGP
jgi:hypothetical protein